MFSSLVMVEASNRRCKICTVPQTFSSKCTLIETKIIYSIYQIGRHTQKAKPVQGVCLQKINIHRPTTTSNNAQQIQTTVYVQIFEGRKFRGFRGYLAIREFFILENSRCLGLAQWLITGS